VTPAVGVVEVVVDVHGAPGRAVQPAQRLGPLPNGDGGAGLTRADLARLYLAFARPLQGSVGAEVRASRPVLEDACQFAWSQLVRDRDHVRPETVLAWLIRTATREARRLLRVEAREPSLEAELESQGDTIPVPAAHEPTELAQRHEQLALVGQLPVRQQRIIWLRALGLSQVEMAAHERCTYRTAERRLTQARDWLRAAADAA